MLTIVRLGGALAKKYGKEFHLSIRRPIDAIKLLQCSFPDFLDTLREYEKRGLGFRMTEIGGGRTDLTLDATLVPKQPKILRLAPVVIGAGEAVHKSNTQLAIAAVLVAATVVSGGSMAPTTAKFLVMTAVSFALQGALGHYSAHEMAKQKKKDFVEKSPSQMFSNVGNVTEPGGPVPVGYGTMLIGSTVVGVSVETYDIST
jgi:predicted phage tail protein